MKILLLAFIFITTNVFAISRADLIKDFELANVYSADWYEAGTSYIAESENQYRYLKVNIAPNKASVFVHFRPDANFEINAISPCYRIAKLIPYERANNWGSEKTSDEEVLASVFHKGIQIGETKVATLDGWNIEFQRNAQTKATCSIRKEV